jgi:Protein of unknown function (DUF1573)
MNKMLFILFAAGLFACQTADKKAGVALSQEEKDKAARDSANFTTIEWLDSTFKDLGNIKEGQVVEVSYRFKNSGDKPLIIAGVTASCGCTVPEKPEKPIAPGQEEVIKAKFDSKGRPKGENRKDVFVTANTKPESSMQLSFKVVVTE